MSVRAVEWALYEAEIPTDGPDQGAQLVLLALADSANREHHMAWLGLPTMARACRRSTDQARRYRDHLIRSGLIADVTDADARNLPAAYRSIRLDRRPRIYRLAVDGPLGQPGDSGDATPQGCDPAESGPRGGNTPGHGVASDATRTIGTEGTSRAGARGTDSPSPEGRPAGAPAAPDRPDLPARLFAEWQAIRVQVEPWFPMIERVQTHTAIAAWLAAGADPDDVLRTVREHARAGRAVPAPEPATR